MVAILGLEPYTKSHVRFVTVRSYKSYTVLALLELNYICVALVLRLLMILTKELVSVLFLVFLGL